MRFSKIHAFLLLTICAVSVLLILPTINNNIENPGLIVYFNGDEGYTMDCMWFYYSGQKRDSYQMDVDYGIEWLYVTDLTRLIVSRFVDIKPGTLILIMRWIHLVSWVGALLALWFFVGCHFGKGWQQTAAVLLLASRPGFDYISNSAKPEPLVLLIMIAGFHFILKIIEKPSIKYLLLSTLCAAAAFAIKFAGVFLIPAIITAMYFSKRYRADTAFHTLKHNWILEFLIGTLCVALPFLFVLFYVRESTGRTYFEEFGVLESFFRNKISILMLAVGSAFILFSAIISCVGKTMKRFSELNSYALVVSSVFFAFLLLLELRWILTKLNVFYATYSYNFFDFLGVSAIKTVSASGILTKYLSVVGSKILSFDAVILFLFAIYLGVELYPGRRNFISGKLRFYKRMTLNVMLIPIFLAIFSIGRFSHHHMLPFFVAASVLALQGAGMLKSEFGTRPAVKFIFLPLIGILFATSITAHGRELINLRRYQYRQKEDIVFEIEKWWRKNIPQDDAIVSDHHAKVYVPPEYKNVKFMKSRENKIEQLKALVNTFYPRIVYCNSGYDENSIMPPIQEILPGLNVKLLASFESAGRSYKRGADSRYLVYEIDYGLTP